VAKIVVFVVGRGEFARCHVTCEVEVGMLVVACREYCEESRIPIHRIPFDGMMRLSRNFHGAVPIIIDGMVLAVMVVMVISWSW